MTGTPAVAIVGGGPAGLTAAATLRQEGIEDILVIEREGHLGGIPRHCGHRTFGVPEFTRLLTGPDYAKRLAGRLDGAIRSATETTVVGLSPGGRLHITSPDGPGEVKAGRVLLATGVRETPRAARLVSGTRPWGVVTTGALQQFVYLAGRKPFHRAVVVGSELVSFSALLTLRHAGIEAVAMIEEGPRITARRPADSLTRAILRVPVWTGTRLVSIEGKERVTGITVARNGGTQRLECDGVVFTGRFVPEAAVLATSHLALDPGSGGPAVDQCWRCSDPSYFAAGNLLHPVETSAVAVAEGAAAARSIADDLSGRLPAAERRIEVGHDEPLRFVYPQTIAAPGPPPGPLQMRARARREVHGRLGLVLNGTRVWSRRMHLLPERRITLPWAKLDPDALKSVRIEFREA